MKETTLTEDTWSSEVVSTADFMLRQSSVLTTDVTTLANMVLEDVAIGIVANGIGKVLKSAKGMRIDKVHAAGRANIVDDLIGLLKEGKKTPDGRNIITKIDDNAQILFRKDTGKHAHKMKTKGYDYPVDHYNIEIQTKNINGKFTDAANYHIVLDESDKIIDYWLDLKKRDSNKIG